MTHSIGQRITAERERRGLTLREFAEQLGWPHQTLHNYEAGTRAVSLDRLVQIAQALQIPPAVFLIEDPVVSQIVHDLLHDTQRRADLLHLIAALDTPLPDPPMTKDVPHG